MTYSADVSTAERFGALFQPRAVAIVGASPAGTGPGSNFLRNLRAYGYKGNIYPIHPTASTIDGLAAYPSLGETPTPIDYAYVAISAARVPEVLSVANGRVCFAQIMSSGFGETENGRDLQELLVAAGRSAKMRLLGPNCMGTHSPRGQLTFVENADPALGAIGVLSQSGGLSIDILRRGFIRGLKFSGLVSLGNSADLDACDLLEYFFADDQTRVIGLYLEDVNDGRRLLDVLRSNRGAKPIVLLKGGKTQQGRRATASHTGAIGTDERIWTGIARQFGLAMVSTLDEFLNALLVFQCLTPSSTRPTRRVVLLGNGGGTNVLAADSFGMSGFDIDRFASPSLEALERLQLPPGASVENPVDVPANALRKENGRIIEKILDIIFSTHLVPDALIVHINIPAILAYKEADFLSNVVEIILATSAKNRSTHIVLVLRSDGELAIEERRRRYVHQAIALGIPAFNEIAEAAQALSAFRDYEGFKLQYVAATHKTLDLRQTGPKSE